MNESFEFFLFFPPIIFIQFSRTQKKSSQYKFSTGVSGIKTWGVWEDIEILLGDFLDNYFDLTQSLSDSVAQTFSFQTVKKI
jgi:hypothetical protein